MPSLQQFTPDASALLRACRAVGATLTKSSFITSNSLLGNISFGSQEEMSSLKATQADGYYIPPAYFESGSYKKKSLSQFAGSHGHNQFLTHSVVRFELPYDGFCMNAQCQAVASKGTRFNAKKSHVDNYHTSKIYEFVMKCVACNEEFRIRNNPKGQCFDYVAGIRRKTEEFDTVEAQSHGIIDTELGNAIIPSRGLAEARNVNTQDPLSKLETRIVGERKALSDRESLELLIRHNAVTVFDDGECNSKLRSVYRADRKSRKRRKREASILGLGESFELHDHISEDFNQAHAVFVDKRKQRDRSNVTEKLRFRTIRRESIFPTSSKNTTFKIMDKAKSKGKGDETLLQVDRIVDDDRKPTRLGGDYASSSIQLLLGYSSDSSFNPVIEE